jgi:CheY-like chemotaxis protein
MASSRLLQTARSCRATPPRRACSGFVHATAVGQQFDDRKRALPAGFQMHLSKPVSVAELLATISNLSRMTSTAK